MQNIKEKCFSYLEKYKDNKEKIDLFLNYIERYIPEEKHEEIVKNMNEALGEVDEDDVCEIIRCLKRRDMSVSGMKWNKQEAMNFATQYNIASRLHEYGYDLDCLFFWFTLNYVYATHYNVNRSMSGYIELAIDEICNRNICLEDIMKQMLKKKKEETMK